MPKYKRCTRCRKDHKSCAPEDRPDGIRCQRCEKYNYDCSNGVTKHEDPNVLKCTPCRRNTQTCERRGQWPMQSCQRCLKEKRECTASYTAQNDPLLAASNPTRYTVSRSITNIRVRDTYDLLQEHDFLIYVLSRQEDFIHTMWFPDNDLDLQLGPLWSHNLLAVRNAATERLKKMIQEFQTAIRSHAANGRHQEVQLLSSSLTSSLILRGPRNSTELPIELLREIVDIDMRNTQLCAALYKQQCIVRSIMENSGNFNIHDANNNEDIKKWIELNKSLGKISAVLSLRIDDISIHSYKMPCRVDEDTVHLLSTPLHRICSIKNVENSYIGLVLREWPSLINSKNIAGETPLHVSVRSKNCKASEYLLSQGAEPHVKDECGRTPLMWVYYYELWELVELFQPFGFSKVEELSGPFKLGFREEPCRMTLLQLLCHFGNDSQFERLISAGCDIIQLLDAEYSGNRVKRNDMTALKAAVSGHNTQILRTLVRFWHGNDRFQLGSTDALYFALDNIWLPEAMFLLDHATDLAIHNYLQKLFDEAEDDRLSPDETRQWCFERLPVLIPFCLKFGGESIPPRLLEIAIALNSFELVTQILDIDATSARHKKGKGICSPLRFVVRKEDRLDILIRTLQRSDVDVDATDSYGETALHESVRYKRALYVEILLKYGASPHIQNRLVQTPAKLAENMELFDIAEILRREELKSRAPLKNLTLSNGNPIEVHDYDFSNHDYCFGDFYIYPDYHSSGKV